MFSCFYAFMIYCVLHNIRSLYNVGSMFRTADAAGIEKIYLTGYTPVPVDAFGKLRSEVVKTALGAEKNVPWENCRRISEAFRKLRKDDVQIIALEQHTGTVDYHRIKPKRPFALVVGNEVRGLSLSVLKKCDIIVEIPMRGKKESLNVSVAFGIALFTLKDTSQK